MKDLFQVLVGWIKTFKSFYLHIFNDNFAITQGLQKNFIKKKAIDLFKKLQFRIQSTILKCKRIRFQLSKTHS